jgi:hypothetical protein
MSASKKLELAITYGRIVLLEDVGKDLDPSLDNLLTKSTYVEDLD